jgi:hypothetical protein
MKSLSILFILFLLTFQGFSQVDRSAYYAAPRLDYYTTEEVGEVIVYVPEQSKNLKISIDIVFEYETLNRGFLVSSIGVSTVPFPMKLLREGNNELTVSFYENDKWIDSRKIFLTIRPERENAVKVEKVNGGLYTNGQIIYPFGFFTYSPVDHSMLSSEAVNGFNMLSPYQETGKKTLKDRRAYMDRSADLGMRVNYNVCSIAGGGGNVTSTSEGLTISEKKELLSKEIELFREHPALLTWYIAEQPDARNFPPDSLVNLYKHIKELDPYHPVAILLSSPRNVAQYKAAADIIMTAPSPVPQGSLREVSEYTSIPGNALWLEKPVWVVPQAFGGNEWWKREPGPKEIRAMTYLAVINGASGIQYFVRSAPNSFPKSTATWSECSSIALEIAELAPDILAPFYAPGIISENTAIKAKAYNRAGLVTIIAVNEKPEPTGFKLKLNDIDLTISAEVLFENRGIVVVDGAIEDMIDGYGTRIYRFDARQKVDKVDKAVASNMAVDAGFEDITTAGVPSACYAYNGYDPGSTYFIDSRRHYQGDHSLRMNNPSEKPGNSLAFYGLELDKKKSYTISIMAMAGRSPNKSGGKKGGPVKFKLSLGSAQKSFDCSATWQNYEINGIMPAGFNEETGKVCPKLELAGKGTAWFDLLQVYPDMELVESPGSAENLRIIEVKCIHPDAKMYYTIDGSEPTTASTPYLVPVEIEQNSIFKAAAFKDNVRVGHIMR